MSTCVSRRGEYSHHTFDPDGFCEDCGAQGEVEFSNQLSIRCDVCGSETEFSFSGVRIMHTHLLRHRTSSTPLADTTPN